MNLQHIVAKIKSFHLRGNLLNFLFIVMATKKVIFILNKYSLFRNISKTEMFNINRQFNLNKI